MTNAKVAIIGPINSGKSSLINAVFGKDICPVSARGGETKERKSIELKVSSNNCARLEVWDTPGLEEANNSKCETDAFRAVLDSDVVLYVFTGDLRDTDIAIIEKVHCNEKPILAIHNKSDLYAPKQMNKIREEVKAKIGDLLGSSNIVYISAAPLGVYYDKHGTRHEISGKPQIESLLAKLNEIAFDSHKIRSLDKLIRKYESETQSLSEKRETALQSIFNHALTAAAAVAINPIPIVDLGIGAGTLVHLVNSLSDIYIVTLDGQEVEKLSKEVWVGAVSVLGGVIASNVIGSFLKAIPVIGTVAGGLIQASSAGYLVYVFGYAVMSYFENGKKWRHGTTENTIKEILKEIDKNSITEQISRNVRAKLGLA